MIMFVTPSAVLNLVYVHPAGPVGKCIKYNQVFLVVDFCTLWLKQRRLMQGYAFWRLL